MRLHEALPQLGADIEIIETMNPRTFYDLTHRKLGMVLGIDPATVTPGSAALLSHHTSQPNVFMVGDTITGTAGMDAVVESALILANPLTK